jgi:GABA(A) receptor-associated protein
MFKNTYTNEKRQQEAQRIMSKYPDKIAIIVEKKPGSELPNLDKKKYLTPDDITVGQFMYVIRKRIKIPAEKSMFFFTNKGKIPASSTLMRQVYVDNQDDDGFLYFTIDSENTFG